MGVCQVVRMATIEGADELLDERGMLRGGSLQGVLPRLAGAHARIDGGQIARRLAQEGIFSSYWR